LQIIIYIYKQQAQDNIYLILSMLVDLEAGAKITYTAVSARWWIWQITYTAVSARWWIWQSPKGHNDMLKQPQPTSSEIAKAKQRT